VEAGRRALLNSVRSCLCGQSRWESGEVVSLGRRAPVAPVLPIAVVLCVVTTATILRWTIIASSVVHSLAIRAASILCESDATVAATTLIGTVTGGLHVIIVEGAGVEDNSREEHTLVHSAVFGHVVVYCDALVVLEASELLLCCGKRELEAAVWVVRLCLLDLARKTLGELAVDLELGGTRFLRVEVLSDFLVKRMTRAEDEGFVAECIAANLVIGQERVFGSHGVKQTLLIDEWKYSHTLPGELFAVEIDLEVFGVELDDRAVLIGHQGVEDLGNGMVGARRHDTHQLLVRPERLALAELNLQVSNVLEVGTERRVVVRVVPSPTRATLEVVKQHPAETFNVGVGDLASEVDIFRRNMELLLVVTGFVAILPELDGVFGDEIDVGGVSSQRA
jgi:hypothetical protein